MNVDFEIFEAGPVVQATDRPHVTINTRVHIFLNRYAIGAIGNPDAVTLMFDRRRKIIGIMPSERRHKRSFPLRNKNAVPTRGQMIHAKNFCNEYGIHVSETLAFTSPEVNHNGILVLSLHEVRSAKKA